MLSAPRDVVQTLVHMVRVYIYVILECICIETEDEFTYQQLAEISGVCVQHTA